MKLHKLDFNEIQEEYPDRYNRGTLASVSINRDVSKFVVQFPDSDDSHIVILCSTPAGFFGRCGCKGFEFNNGPCSHISIVHRAIEAGLVSSPILEISRAIGDIRFPEQEHADQGQSIHRLGGGVMGP